MPEIFYVKEPNTLLFKRAGQTPSASGATQLLLGGRLHVDMTTAEDGWARATTVPDKEGDFKTGFVELARLSQRQQLKIFYMDVGQGDATLIEAEDTIIIIDGGPNTGFHRKLTERLASLRRADEAIGLKKRTSLHIDAIFISHFDKDHYFGLTKVLTDENFTVGTIYHNGLPRYGDPADKDLNLGKISHDKTSITTDLRDLDSGKKLLDDKVLLTTKNKLNDFGKFLKAAIGARKQNRLGGFELLVKRDANDTLLITRDIGNEIRLEVLGPVTTSTAGEIRLPTFPDPHKVRPGGAHSPKESHTINGNSIVLHLTFGDTTFLFGGDLNQPAQRYLAEKYGSLSAFSADVNKACHHGSSDFDLDYVRAVSPHATVFSSGDNGSYDHPLPDAMGTAARHSQGDFPLIFSTELARDVGGGIIKYGHINARSNGEVIVMAQKKEKPSSNRTWHPFPLPFAGPFPDHHT